MNAGYIRLSNPHEAADVAVVSISSFIMVRIEDLLPSRPTMNLGHEIPSRRPRSGTKDTISLSPSIRLGKSSARPGSRTVAIA